MRLLRSALRLISLVVPAVSRPRWREEWLAELNHARSHGRSRRDRLAMAAGAIPDALATRRVAKTAATTGPRPGVFHALDQDVRYAMRGLAKSPGFALGVVLSLAVGIGANAAAFSFIDAAVFRPFPGVRDQHELVRIHVGSATSERIVTRGMTYRDFETMRDTMSTLDGLSAQRDGTFAIFAEGQASAVPGALVSANYFDVLGLAPAAGRFFLDREDRTVGTDPVAVISDALWERLYARNPSAIGRTLIVNGVPAHIIGVTPRLFMGVRKNRLPDIWVPMSVAELVLRDRDGRPARLERAGELFLDYVGRRRTDVTIEQVSAEAAVFGARLDATRPESRSRVAVTRVWLNDPANNIAGVFAFMALPMLVLAIACVNAANLVLARSSRHVRDWTVRLALGATRWRVVRQVLAESMILSVAAAGLGLLLARWALSFIASQIPFPMPLDHRVALFTIVIAVLTAVAFSLGPALGVTARASRRLAPASPAAGGPAKSRTRFALVALQAALSLGLLATGAQFTKTVQASATQEYIPDPERLVLTSFDLDPLRLEREAGDDFYRRLLERVSVVPGVAAAGFSTRGLVTGPSERDSFARVWVPNSPPEGQPQMAFQVSPGLLDAVGVPLFEGRRFTAEDATAPRTVVVNKPFVAKFLNGRALGQTFRFGPARGGAAGGTDVTVVGVVDGMLKRGDQEPPIVYYPAPLAYQQARSLYIRLDRTGTFTAAALHAAAREVDARVPMAEVSTLANIRGEKDREVKMLTRAAGLLGILALLLAAGGLYGVVSYIVSLRRQEVGIRMALGAEVRSIVGMIVRQALLPTLVGAAIGAGCAAAAGTLIRSRLYGASPVDPVAFGGATLLMLVVMIVASWIPARHAGRVDPIAVLRQE
jgi:putative ABC transport system permease protein